MWVPLPNDSIQHNNKLVPQTGNSSTHLLQTIASAVFSSAVEEKQACVSSDFECLVVSKHARVVISSALWLSSTAGQWFRVQSTPCAVFSELHSSKVAVESDGTPSDFHGKQLIRAEKLFMNTYNYICICVALDIFKFNCIFYRLSTGVVNYMEYGQRCQKPNLGFLIWYYYGSEPARMPFAGYDRWRLEYWYQDGTAVTVVDEYRRYVVGSQRLLYGRAPYDLWWHNAFFDLGSQGCLWWTPADKVKNPRRSNYELWPATTLFSCVLLGLHPCVFLRSCCCLCN